MIKKMILGILRQLGYEIHRIPLRMPEQDTIVPNYDKIHYGSGRNYLDGWINTDIIATGPANYMYLNLVGRHPFPDDFFRLAFSEDFIEHIDQAASLMFLMEAYRTLKPGGVFRITTPDFEKVLTKHYFTLDYFGFETGREEAFESLGHIHFYSRDSLASVAKHIGFKIAFVEEGASVHPELNLINTRSDMVYLHAELTK